MAAPDALRLLISACSRRLDLSLVTESGQSIDDLSLSTHISLPSSTSSEPLLLPKATPTRLLSPDGTPYDLQSLVLFWLNRDAPLADYMRKSTAVGARPIGIQLKRSVLEILEGRRQPNEKEVLPEGAFVSL